MYFKLVSFFACFQVAPSQKINVEGIKKDWLLSVRFRLTCLQLLYALLLRITGSIRSLPELWKTSSVDQRTLEIYVWNENYVDEKVKLYLDID